MITEFPAPGTLGAVILSVAMPSLIPPMPPDVLPPQGHSNLCWAASLICAARYHAYPTVRGIDCADDVEALVWREQRTLHIPPAWLKARDVCNWSGGRDRILLLARALDINCEATTPEEILGHLAHGRPVIAGWEPARVDLADPIRGRHFGVICSWTSAGVQVTDSLHNHSGEPPGTRARMRPPIPAALFEAAMGKRSSIAVLPR